MKHQFSTLLILITLFFGYAHFYTIFDKKTLLSLIADVPEPSKCIVTCIEPLKKPFLSFLHQEISANSSTKMCRALNETEACIKNNILCTEDDRNKTEKLTRGFRWACEKMGLEAMGRVNHCIESIPREIRLLKDCRKKCNSTKMIPKFLDEPRTNNLISRLEHFCKPLSCHLNCTAMTINHYCPTAGSRLINQFLMPFDAMAIEMERSSYEQREEIRKVIPSACRWMVTTPELMAIRFDREFILDVVYILLSTSQRSSHKASTEAERILAEYDIYGVRIIRDSAHKPKPKETWGVLNVGMLALMIIILLLNIFGLIFSIWWCLNIRGENGRPILNSVSTALLEPNIRMKLKLPKMKIHDSEVLKLRVPRNGNQHHQDEDEQTVVVPRQKRRRTYSVPLEPRTRTESTGSDKFPRIFILRNQNHV